MPKQFRSKLIYKEVVVRKQSLEDLIEDNKDYLVWLEKQKGKKAKESFIRHLKKELDLVPETGTKMKIPVLEVKTYGEPTNSNDIQNS